MLLSNLTTRIKGSKLNGEDKTISGISADSRSVEKDFVFFAINGTKTDGTKFINQAIGNGACAIVTEKDVKLPDSISIIKVDNVRSALSFGASVFYPNQPENIVAITGTSGKTSTVQFVRQLLKHSDINSASIGTLGLISPNKKHYYGLTTPDSITMHKMIDETTKQGVTDIAIEASSHGIELNRLDALNINIAAFTNLSRDHLDYHETMEKYLESKLRLFTELLNKDGMAVLNADIDEYEKISSICKNRGIKIISYGEKGKDIKLISSSPDSNGQIMNIEVMGKEHKILLPVIGSFQIDNCLCALAITIASGQKPIEMIENISKLSGVPGRLEFIGKSSKGGNVFVDYAHKPSALEKVLSAMKIHTKTSNSKLHVIIGCGGDRDKGKRPQMAKISQDLADNVIITDDNPRSENPNIIRQDMLKGCTPSSNLREIGDRATAIKEAIDSLDKNDALIIAGKGHEDGQIIGDKVIPFNDATEARKALGL